jgi:hypothetical protein
MLKRLADEGLETAEKELQDADSESLDDLTTNFATAEEQLLRDAGALAELVHIRTPADMCVEVM